MLTKIKKGLAQTPILLAAIPVLLIIIASALITYKHMQYTFEQKGWVLHTQEVLLALSELELAVKTGETNQRGYLLTNDSTYLPPYEKALANVNTYLKKLDVLLADNHSQKERLELVRKTIVPRMQLLKSTVELQKEGKTEIAVALVKTGKGKQRMQHLAEMLDIMELEEQRLLKLRTELQENATAESYNRLLFLATLTILGFGGAGYLISKAQLAEAREKRGQEIIHRISQVLAQPLPTEKALRNCLAVLCEEIDWTAAGFWQPVENDKVLSLISFYSKIDAPEFEASSRIHKFEKGQGLPGEVWKQNCSVWLENVSDSNNFPRAATATKVGIVSAFAFPVILGEQFLGVFELFSEARRPPDYGIIRLFEIVSTEIGQLILRRTMENQLAEANGLLDSILQHNPAADRIFGGAPEGISRQEWTSQWEILFEDAVTQYTHEQWPLIRALKGEEIDDEILLCKNAETPDGVWVNINARPLKNRNGEIVGGIVVMENITARRDAERRVSEFYSTVSHELRTPLTSIRGALGLMEGGKAGELSPRAQRLVAMGRKESERLIRLINDILDIRKLEAGKVELFLDFHDCNALLTQSVESLRSYAAEREVILDTELSSFEKIKVDKDRFIQIITNLISNAVKFSPAGSTVEVKSDREDANLKFSVIDHGEGISKSNQRKLFSLFQQVNSSDNRPKEGTGLGLAISKALVEQHGGSIGVESELGQGAKFWFRLPYITEPRLNKLDTIVQDTGANSDDQTGDDERYSGTNGILLVEDDDSSAELIIMNLKDAGFSVKHAKSLKEAREVIASGVTPKVVVLDIGLPDGNGLELIDSLNEDGKTIPVVVITAQQAQSNYSSPLLIDWIRKPFEDNRLLQAVKVSMQKRLPGPARVMIVEDDDSTREVIEQQLSVLKIEFLLASNGEDAISKARELKPDLIVLDLGLPRLDGFGVVTVLRHDQDLKDTPLIVYTARDLDDNDKHRLSLGLTAYLTKSRTSESEFLANVRELLNGLCKQNQDKLPTAE